MSPAKLKHVEFFSRPDGVNGVGFRIHYAGRPQYSVAWPDRPAERFTADELERKQIRRVRAVQISVVEQLGEDPAETNGEGKPAETVTKTTVDELYEGELSSDETPGPSEPGVWIDEESAKSPEKFAEAISELTDKPDEDAAAPVTEPVTEGETVEPTEPEPGAPEPVSEADAIRRYLADHPDAQNRDVVAALAEQGVKVGSSQVSREKRKL